LVFETLQVKLQSLTISDDLMLFMWVFSTPYSAVRTINVSTQGEPWFVRKKQIFQHTKPILLKTHVVDLIITAKLLANNTEARKWTCTERLRKCWKCPLQMWELGVGRSVFNACFSTVYLILGCVLYVTRCLKPCDIAHNAWSGKLLSTVAFQFASVRCCTHHTVPQVSTTATGSRDHYVLSKLYQAVYDWLSLLTGWQIFTRDKETDFVTCTANHVTDIFKICKLHEKLNPCGTRHSCSGIS